MSWRPSVHRPGSLQHVVKRKLRQMPSGLVPHPHPSSPLKKDLTRDLQVSPQCCSLPIGRSCLWVVMGTCSLLFAYGEQLSLKGHHLFNCLMACTQTHAKSNIRSSTHLLMTWRLRGRLLIKMTIEFTCTSSFKGINKNYFWCLSSSVCFWRWSPNVAPVCIMPQLPGGVVGQWAAARSLGSGHTVETVKLFKWGYSQ